jgi:hypothetical protein
MGASPTGILGHDHNPITHLDAPWLRHFHYFARRLVAVVRRLATGHKVLVFGAHGRRMNFDNDPVLLRMGRRRVNNHRPALADNGGLLHIVFLTALSLVVLCKLNFSVCCLNQDDEDFRISRIVWPATYPVNPRIL